MRPPRPPRRAVSETPSGWQPGSLTYVPSSEPPPALVGKPTIAESILLRVFRRFPANTTIFRDASDDAAREHESEREWPVWRSFGRGPELMIDRDVLDLGCGWGGRSVRWLEVGAKSVCGIEVAHSQVSLATDFARKAGVADRALFLVGVGEDIPCPDRSFDLVVMYDVMEHVVDPEEVVKESYRVLRPGGRLATVFPPYYNIFGGSHLHGYATSVPGLNVVFPTKALKRATLRLFAEQGIDHRPYLRDVSTDKLWNMNGLTVRAFNKLVKESEFEVEQLWLVGHLDRRYVEPTAPPRSFWRRVVRPLAFAASAAAASAPLLRELFCSRVCAVLRKPAVAD